MGKDKQNLEDAYQEWAAAANRRIQNTKTGNNWGVGPTYDWAKEKAADVNVRRWETANSPATEKGTEVNSTKQRADDLDSALKAAQEASDKPAPQFGSNAKLKEY